MEGQNILIILFLAIFILLAFRRSLSLLMVKWIYGEYSKKYILKFKKRTRKKPHPYCFKDDFYYHVLSIPKAVNCKIQYKSEHLFEFDHLNFEKNFKQNLSENGKPDCYTISEERGVDLSVIGYESSVFHSNEKTLLYHCKNDYFMGEYVFTSLTDDTSSLIVNLLRKQFNSKIEQAKNFSISDSKGNYLYFTDTGFFLSVKFFNINQQFIKKILARFGDKEDNHVPLEGFGKAICA